MRGVVVVFENAKGFENESDKQIERKQRIPVIIMTIGPEIHDGIISSGRMMGNAAMMTPKIFDDAARICE